MIVSPPTLRAFGDQWRISARVQIEAQLTDFPKEIWFEIPREMLGEHPLPMDGFAVALFMQAMHLGETLQLQGCLSRKLMQGLDTCQTIFHAWFPQWFQKIELIPDQLTPAIPSSPSGIGFAFSGGVDSSYTLKTHLDPFRTQAQDTFTHGVFVHGFDIPLAAAEVYAHWAGRFKPALARQGIDLVCVRSNVQDFLRNLPWIIAHGPALCSVALILAGRLSRFFVPASAPYTDLEPWGSHPLTDPLLSTEALEIVHDGCRPRVEKILSIADWPPAQSWLRVCWEHPSVHGNCCRCHNCLNTMAALELAGTLSAFTWFTEDLDRNRLSQMRIPAAERAEAEALLALARTHADPGIAQALQLSINRQSAPASPPAVKSTWKRMLRRFQPSSFPLSKAKI